MRYLVVSTRLVGVEHGKTYTEAELAAVGIDALHGCLSGHLVKSPIVVSTVGYDKERKPRGARKDGSDSQKD
jgi:hypothetical protein